MGKLKHRRRRDKLQCEAINVRVKALHAATLTFGLWRDEALGLSWSNIDLGSGLLHIRRHLRRERLPAGQQQETGRKTRFVLQGLKTEKSRRTLHLTPALDGLLRTHRARQARERLAAGPEWGESGLVFTTGRAHPSTPTTSPTTSTASAPVPTSGIGRRTSCATPPPQSCSPRAPRCGSCLRCVGTRLGGDHQGRLRASDRRRKAGCDGGHHRCAVRHVPGGGRPHTSSGSLTREERPTMMSGPTEEHWICSQPARSTYE